MKEQGKRRKLHNENINKLHQSNIFKLFKAKMG